MWSRAPVNLLPYMFKEKLQNLAKLSGPSYNIPYLYLSYFIIYPFWTFTTWKRCAAMTLCITFHSQGMSDRQSFDRRSQSFFLIENAICDQHLVKRSQEECNCDLFSFLFSNRPCYWFFKNLQINSKHVFCYDQMLLM